MGGCLFAAFFSLSSFVLEDLNSLEPLDWTLFLLRATASFPLWYALLSAACVWADCFSATHVAPSFLIERGKELGLVARKRIRLIFLGAEVLFWGIILSACFPGNLTGDTLKSVLSFTDPLQGENVPFLLNILYGGSILLGDALGNADMGVFTFCLIQTILYIWCFADFFSLLWFWGAPRGLVLFAAGLTIVLPVFSTYAFSMVKDATFTLCMLYFIKAALVLLLEGEGAPYRGWVLLSVSAILTSLTRNGAFLLVIFPLIWLFCLFPRKRYFLTFSITLLLLLTFCLPRLLGLPASQIRENLSLPLQQIARVIVLHEEELSEDEKADFEAVMPIEAWKNYTPSIADSVKRNFARDPNGAYLKHFFSLWGNQLLQRGEVTLEAALLMNYAYFTPLADRSDLKVRLFLGTERFPVKKVTVVSTLTENKTSALKAIHRWDAFLNGIPVIRLLCRIGLYSWLLIASFVYCAVNRKKRRFVLLLLPELFLLIGCCFSPVNGHYRYGFPLIAIQPLLIPAVILPDQS